MITVSPVEGSYYNGIIVDGHAEYAEHGYDIICASASAVVIMAYNGLSLSTLVLADMKNGYSKLELLTKNDSSDLLMESAYMTLRELEKQHPDYITVEDGSI